MDQESVVDLCARGALDRKSSAQYLSISTRLLDQLAAAGKIRRLHIGRKPLYRVADLDAFLTSLAEGQEGRQ